MTIHDIYPLKSSPGALSVRETFIVSINIFSSTPLLLLLLFVQWFLFLFFCCCCLLFYSDYSNYYLAFLSFCFSSLQFRCFLFSLLLLRFFAFLNKNFSNYQKQNKAYISIMKRKRKPLDGYNGRVIDKCFIALVCQLINTSTFVFTDRLSNRLNKRMPFRSLSLLIIRFVRINMPLARESDRRFTYPCFFLVF